MRKAFVIALGLLFFSLVQAQKGENVSYNFSFGEGYVIPTNDFLKGKGEGNSKHPLISNFSLRISKLADKSKNSWHLYSDYRYGFGLYHGIFSNSEHLGNPFGVYAFAGFSPLKKEKFTLKNELALGISGVWDYYSEDNPTNIAVSMPLEVYVHWSLEAYWQLQEHYMLNAGIMFTHFSNGALKKPNKGINILTPNVGISYTPKPVKTEQKEYKTLFSPALHSDITTWIGIHAESFPYEISPEVFDTIQESYPVIGQQWRFTFDVSPKYEIGAGAELIYNSSVWKTDSMHYRKEDYKRVPFENKLTLAAFLTFNYNVKPFSVSVEFGRNVTQRLFHASQVYQRLGLRYYAGDNFFVQMALRAYELHVAEYIEWGIGYRFY
ncbi:MAG: acyloxyacyl hydrolase [Bacteroidales bacterium]|nr:acyloxyacyl hydrolase [Bacteroidales bacterium]